MMAGRLGRLSGMMALLYAVQGSWWPLLAVHLQDLGVSGRGRGWIFATLAIASIVTPQVAGQVADRVVATQRLLAALYASGAALLAVIAAGTVEGAAPLFALFLAYWLLTAPTYGLCAALALRNLERPGEQFGGVRLWGTVGWAAAGWGMTGVLAWRGPGRGAYEAFAVAAAGSMAFALYCLSLPDTPPLAASRRRRLDLDDVRELLRKPAVAVYLAAAFGVSLTTPFVYQVVPAYLRSRGLLRSSIASAMTLGQVLEVVGLAILPAVLRRLGYRRTMAIGIGAWALYYANLAADPPLAIALAGIALNGVAIAGFLVTGQMFLDAQAAPDRRAGAQGVQVMVTSGIGSLLGNLLAGEIVDRCGTSLATAFVVPALIDAGLVVFVLAAFRPATAPAVRRALPTLHPRGTAAAAPARLSPDAPQG